MLKICLYNATQNLGFAKCAEIFHHRHYHYSNRRSILILQHLVLEMITFQTVCSIILQKHRLIKLEHIANKNVKQIKPKIHHDS